MLACRWCVTVPAFSSMVVDQVAAALDAAHEAGLIDAKPPDVLGEGGLDLAFKKSFGLRLRQPPVAFGSISV